MHYNRMKILVMTIILLIAVGLSVVFYILHFFIKGQGLSKTESKEVLKQYYNEFNSVVNIADRIPETYAVIVKSKKQDTYGKVYYIEDMEINARNKLSSEQINIISKSKLYDLLYLPDSKNPYFDVIIIKDDYILFRIKETIHMSGIAYLPTGNISDFNVIEKYELYPDWFYLIYE